MVMACSKRQSHRPNSNQPTNQPWYMLHLPSSSESENDFGYSFLSFFENYKAVVDEVNDGQSGGG